MARQSHEPENHSGLFERFFHSEVTGSVVLLACTLLALLWANSPWSDSYFHILHTKIGLSWGDAKYALSVHHWINDGLMVIFFFVVGLEIKRELVVGRLSSMRQAVLPVTAAVGGLLCPAIIYAALNIGGDGARGWGVPMATDIAFALGVLAVLGKRVPISLKVFLTAAAIADDLAAVLVIAVFYTETIHLSWLLLALVLLALLYLVARILEVRRLGIIMSLIIGVWIAVFASGVHATVAGILVALLVPIKPTGEPRKLLSLMRDRIGRLTDAEVTSESMVFDHDQLEAAVEVEQAARRMQPAGLRLEHYWHPVQAFLVLPLFALANAGIRLDEGLGQALASPIGLGIVLGLVLGKQVGIVLFSWLAIRSGKAELPPGVSWRHIWGASCLAGIGFTMSLFVSDLAFASESLIAKAKLGILAASLVSAVIGFVVLYTALPKDQVTTETRHT
jgi:NhaA family Na+:H+ antiporter